MNKNIRIALVICTICIVLIGVGIFEKYHVAKTSVTPRDVTNTYAPNPLPTGSGNINDPSTWSAYSFNHQFTLAYPPTWVALPDKSENGFDFQTPYFHQDDDFTMPYGNSTDVSYSPFGEYDLSDMSFQNGDQFTDDTTDETNIVTNIAHLQIDNLPAIEFDYYPTDNTHFVKTRIAIQKGKILYRFNTTYADTSGKKLFEEIIKTMKFI